MRFGTKKVVVTRAKADELIAELIDPQYLRRQRIAGQRQARILAFHPGAARDGTAWARIRQFAGKPQQALAWIRKRIQDLRLEPYLIARARAELAWCTGSRAIRKSITGMSMGFLT